MQKFLKNVTTGRLRVGDVGKKIDAGEVRRIDGKDIHRWLNSDDTLDYIRAGDLQVGAAIDFFYSDALEGELYFNSLFDDDAYVLDGSTLEEVTPAVVTDSITGKKSTTEFFAIQSMMRELYNATSNPFYHASVTPILGAGGILETMAGRTLNLETILGKTGWYTQEVKEWAYQKPYAILFYYGWPNAFNSAQNGWDNEKVAQEMSKYRIVVFGNGLELPTHGDHANLQAIATRIKALNSNTQIFGYASVNQTQTAFETQVDNWKDNIGVHGIFMDEAGYDYGKTRQEFNTAVDYVHDEGLICFANAWNMNHVLGTANDPSYPNTTYNPSADESNLAQTDWYLMESLAVNTLVYSGDGVAPKADFVARVNTMTTLRATYGINVAAINVINDSHAQGQALFDFAFIAACIASLEGVGSSDDYYGASSAKTKFWDRPDVSEIGRLWDLWPMLSADNNDADKVLRFLDFGRLMLDFSTGAVDSDILKY